MAGTQRKGEGGRRRTTMVHVAEAAGVSQSTVSFVLNDRRDVVVAEATRERVLQAAAELGYRPNRTAQSLRLNQSFLVGVVTRGIVSGPYAGRIVAGFQREVEAAGQQCMVVEVGGDPAEEEAAVASFLNHGVGAVLYASYLPVPIRPSAFAAETRMLYVNCWPGEPAPGQIAILADEYGGGRSAAAAAFDLGHTEVAFLGGTRDEYACVERQRGFVDAARAAGIDPDRLVQVNGNYEIGSGYDLTLEVFATRRPTALVCGNDRMAVGAMLALHKLGLEVPRDVGLMGFDDQPDMANQLRPGLTTVALPHLEMGRRAGRSLAEPGLLPAWSTVPCPVVWRDSLTRPNQADAG